jgi:hypothetical protein
MRKGISEKLRAIAAQGISGKMNFRVGVSVFSTLGDEPPVTPVTSVTAPN